MILLVGNGVGLPSCQWEMGSWEMGSGFQVAKVQPVHLRGLTLLVNPVRAGMVVSAEDYPWSGHRAYLGQEILPWLSTDWVLLLNSINQ